MVRPREVAINNHIYSHFIQRLEGHSGWWMDGRWMRTFVLNDLQAFMLLIFSGRLKRNIKLHELICHFQK